jgi:hypothetical protein
MTKRYDHSGSKKDGGLSHERLARIISVYGANPRRWPGNAGKLAPANIGTNAELRARLADEAALDEALDSVSAVEIPDRLREQLLARFERFTEQDHARASRRIARLVASMRELVWPGAPWWQPAFALSLSILVGLSVGLAIPAPLPDGGDQQLAAVTDTPTSVDIDQDQ